MLKNICEGYLEQKTEKMIKELLANRYEGKVRENKMKFKNYKQACFDEATKVILERNKNDKKNNLNNTK